MLGRRSKRIMVMKSLSRKSRIIILSVIPAVLLFCLCTLSPGGALRAAAFRYSPISAFTMTYHEVGYEGSYGRKFVIDKNEPVEKATEGHLYTWIVYDVGPFYFAKYYGEA